MDKWLKYALLTKICSKMEEKDLKVSKIYLQYLVFFLNSIFKVPCGYEFKMFTYGPYSVDLISDLDYLFQQDILKIKYGEETSQMGTLILPGPNYLKAISQGEESLIKMKTEIEQVINLFGNEHILDLELKATIIYLRKIERVNKADLINRIQTLKPYFQKEEIQSAFADLIDQKLID